MKVTVARSGGIAGLTRRWEVAIDDRDDRESWIELIGSLPWQDAPRGQRQPDRFSYRIRCSGHQVTLTEQHLTGPWRELVERVQSASS